MRSSNAAQPGKLFAQPSWPPDRADLLRLTSALSLSSEPVVRCSQTSSLRTEASGAWLAALPARAGSPEESPCPASDQLRPARALRSLKDLPRRAQSNQAGVRESRSK